MTMVEAPLGFFEMKDEVFGPNAAKFCHAQLGEAPKAFDAVDVVFAAGKFIFVVMNAMMFIAVENKEMGSGDKKEIETLIDAEYFSIFLPDPVSRFKMGVEIEF